MAYYTKIKKDFTYKGVQLNNIDCYEGDGKSIRVTSAGIGQMVRQIIKSKYPKIYAGGIWVTTDRTSMNVSLNRVPNNYFQEIKQELSLFDDYGYNHRNEERNILKTDDGIVIDASKSYVFVYNEPPYGSKDLDKPAPDWDKILNENTPTPKIGGNKSPKASWDKGTLLRECGGWKVYQKTLPDGREVVSAFKDKETAPNKTDWNLIKGEIYTESGFKWGRFGNFEKWGSVEESQLDKLCSILTKYYGGGKQEETPNEDIIPQYEIDALIYYTKDYYEDEFTLDEIKKAVDEYIQKLKNKNPDWWTWGGGRDSVDRERVYDIMVANKKQKEDSTPSKEDVEKQIRALRYLAEAGDDEAQKQINALKYLLN